MTRDPTVDPQAGDLIALVDTRLRYFVLNRDGNWVHTARTVFPYNNTYDLEDWVVLTQNAIVLSIGK